MFFSTSNLFLSEPTVSKLQNYTFPEPEPRFPMAPSLGFPRAEVQKIGRCFGQCFSQTSQGFVGPVWDIFGGEEGYGIQNMFGRIFLFLQIFVVEIETVLV